MATWFYVLTVISSPTLKPGFEIVSSEAKFSEQTCAQDARLIAQAMFVKDGTKYGYRCEKVDYEPPRLEKTK